MRHRLRHFLRSNHPLSPLAGSDKATLIECAHHLRSSGSANQQRYRIYVRLKGGGQATGRELRTGPPPNHSTVLKVPLVSGRTVKARIGRFRSKGKHEKRRSGHVHNRSLCG
jgi:hypothetical protein